MNAPLKSDVLLLRSTDPQVELPLAAEAVLRYVWESRFGSMLIEVVDDQVYVNGERVLRPQE